MNENITVVVSARHFPRASSGGGSKYAYQLYKNAVNALGNNEYQIDLFGWFGFKLSQKPEEVTVVSREIQNKKGVIKHSFYRQIWHKKYLFKFSKYMQIQNDLKKFRVSIKSLKNRKILFHANDVHTAYLCYKEGIPFIYTHHGKGSLVAEFQRSFNISKEFENYFREQDRIVLENAKWIIFPSKATYKMLKEEYNILENNDRVKVIYTGIPDPVKNGIDKKDIKSLDEIIILSIAEHVPEKNLSLAIQIFSEALKLLPNTIRKKTKFYNCGGFGKDTENLRKLIKEYSIEENVYLLGKVSYEKVQELFKKSVMFLHTPNVAVFDLALLEAMAYGLPVLVTPVGGNYEMFGENYQLYVHDISSGIKKMINILRDNNFRVEISRSNREYFYSNYTINKMIYNYFDLYIK